jgi:YD repeat-containing protein
VYGAGKGVIKTTDGGRTWTQVWNGWGQTVVVTGRPHAAVYVGARASRGSNDCLYRTMDGGTTWQPASNGLPVDCWLWTAVVDPRTPGTAYLGATLLSSTYLTRLTSDGALEFSTYLKQSASALAVDGADGTYLAGSIVTRFGPSISITKIGRGAPRQLAAPAVAPFPRSPWSGPLPGQRVPLP